MANPINVFVTSAAGSSSLYGFSPDYLQNVLIDGAASTPTLVVANDAVNNAVVTFVGSGFVYDNSGPLGSTAVTQGTVSEIHVASNVSGDILTATGFNLGGKALYDAIAHYEQ